MLLNFLLKFIVVLVPLVYISELIIQYRKGEYNPFIFRVEKHGYLKRLVLNLSFILSINFIHDKFFIKIALLTTFIALAVIANTLNFKFIFIQFNKKVFYQTMIFNVISVTMFFLIMLH